MSTDDAAEDLVTIGEAAALYDLPASTLRWWERQGVLPPAGRDGGRRTYDDHDLRRLGLAYVCCALGRMPLDRAAVVTSGTSTRKVWRRTVQEQIARLERQEEQLRTARDYLGHLLSCLDDDIADCPLLDDELTAHTPRGRLADADLVQAARRARHGTRRDEKPSDDPAARDETQRPTACRHCGHHLPRAARGRRRTYCSRACRQRAYRARQQ